MKIYPSLLSLSISLLLILFCCSGCTSLSTEAPPLEQALVLEEGDTSATPEQSDSSCSYFYFLWGTHAENNKRYSEAEEAYEKALICDPDSRAILRRLPILLIRMGKQHGAAQWLRTAIEKFPDDLQDRLLLARLDIRSGEIDEAITLYNELIEMNPEDEAILLHLGFLYLEQNRFKEAEEIFQRVLFLNSESLFAHLYLARIASRTGDMKQAEIWYQKALQINWSIDLAIEVAEFYGAQKRYQEVERQYQSILTKDPTDHRAGLGLVHTLLLQDKEKEAMQVLKELRKNSSDQDQIDLITARLYLRSDKLEKAAEILEPMTRRDDVPGATYMLAVIRYEQKELDNAMELLRTIEQESSDFEDSIYLQVRILMEQQQQTEAIELIKQRLGNEDIVVPGLYTLLASLYMEQNQIQKGYDILDAALLKYPDNTQIYFEYGLLLEQAGAQQQAIVQMEKVLELEPDHAEALNYLGYTWADKGVNLEKALQYIQKSIQIKPGNGYIQDSLGWVYFRMGKLDLAVKEILTALQMEPEDPNIHEHLGDIYQAQGQEGKARQAYQQAKELFKTETGKLRVQEKIDALK
jgi:tetratricopeptide (TPR) repeat protein